MFLRCICLIASLFFASAASAGFVSVNGVLQSEDLLAEDSFGLFNYDLYTLVGTQDETVSLSLNSLDFAPWVGAWASPVLPTFLWEGGPLDIYLEAIDIGNGTTPGSPASISFSALAGVEYQIAVATYEYNPTPLGEYSLSAASDDGELTLTPFVTAIPAPATLGLLAISFAIFTAGLLSPRARGVPGNHAAV